jgi:hypothetical protein
LGRWSPLGEGEELLDPELVARRAALGRRGSADRPLAGGGEEEEEDRDAPVSRSLSAIGVERSGSGAPSSDGVLRGFAFFDPEDLDTKASIGPAWVDEIGARAGASSVGGVCESDASFLSSSSGCNFQRRCT